MGTEIVFSGGKTLQVDQEPADLANLLSRQGSKAQFIGQARE
jgi:hypothetical protein